MVLSPTLTSKQPLRGFSALIVTLPPAALTAASIFAARVLNAPHDLHASMVTAPPPPPPPLLAGFDLAMVLTGLEAGFDLLFGGIFANCCALGSRKGVDGGHDDRRRPTGDPDRDAVANARRANDGAATHRLPVVVERAHGAAPAEHRRRDRIRRSRAVRHRRI